MSKITNKLLIAELAEQFICCSKNAVISHQTHDFTSQITLLCPAENQVSLNKVSLSRIILKQSNRKKSCTGEKEGLLHVSGLTSIPQVTSSQTTPLSSSAQSPTAEHYSSDLPLRAYRNGGMLF